MRCEACNKNLTDREASRKYLNWQQIQNPEQRYIGLCDRCIQDTGITGWHENLSTSNEEIQDENEEPFETPEDE